MTVKHKQHIRMSPADAEVYVGPEGEIIIELETFAIRVQDGVTPGGFLNLTQAVADSLYAALIDFNEEIAQITSDVDAALAASNSALFAKFLISRAPVISIVTALPAPSIGDRYLIAHAGTSGAAVGQEDQVAEYTADGWIFSGAASEGHAVFNQDDSTVYYFNGTTWTTTALDATELAQEAAIATLPTYAPLASPALTGIPTAPTALAGENSTQIATTAYADAAAASGVVADLSVNGSVELAGGFIMKWGHYAGGSSHPTISFAVAFPNACLNVSLTAFSDSADTADAADTYTVRKADLDSYNAAGLTAWCSAEYGIEDVFHAYTGVEFDWRAIGH